MKVKLSRLNIEHNDFIIARLAEGTPMKAIVKEFQEKFPKFGYGSGIPDDEIAQRVYQRIQKIKKKRHNEIQARRDAEPYSDDTSTQPYLSPAWRARRFYNLLLTATTIKDKKKFIKEIRAEATLLSANENSDDTGTQPYLSPAWRAEYLHSLLPDAETLAEEESLLKEMREEEKRLRANENKGKGDDLPMRDLVSELDLDPRKFKNEYDNLSEQPTVKRLSDGVEFGADGKSLLSILPENSEDDSDDDVYPPRIPLFGKIATVLDEYDTNDPRFFEEKEPTKKALDTNDNTNQPEAAEATADILYKIDDWNDEDYDLGDDWDDEVEKYLEPEPTEQDNFRRGIGFDRNEGNLFVK